MINPTRKNGSLISRSCSPSSLRRPVRPASERRLPEGAARQARDRGLTDALVVLTTSNGGARSPGCARCGCWRRSTAAPEALDAHPLVREWFGDRLKQTNEAAWKAAHSRLSSTRDTTRERNTPTLEELAPLDQAIGHAAAPPPPGSAGQHLRRPHRPAPAGRRAQVHAAQTLGALGSDLAASYPVLRQARCDSGGLADAGRHLKLGSPSRSAFTRARRAVWPRRCRRPRGAADGLRKRGARRTAHAASTSAKPKCLPARSPPPCDGEKARRPCRPKRLSISDDAELAETLPMPSTQPANGIRRPRAVRRGRARRTAARRTLLYAMQGYGYCDLLLWRRAGRRRARPGRQTSAIARHNNWVARHRPRHARSAALSSRLALPSVGAQNVGRVGGPDDARAAALPNSKAVDGLRASGQVMYLPRGLLARSASAAHRRLGRCGARSRRGRGDRRAGADAALSVRLRARARAARFWRGRSVRAAERPRRAEPPAARAAEQPRRPS